MPRTLYTLLVGIDNYPPEVNSLAGCVNDIRRVEQLLQERVTGHDDRFDPLVLTDAAATRQGVIDGFRDHLGQAGPEDVAIFYYSGHGSQQISPPEFWHLEPDHLDETLVCYDSRSGAWDLADKELAQLIADVAARGPHVVVILDCCHSGSGTRDLALPAEGVRIRRAPTDRRARPLASFIVSREQADAFPPTARGGGQSGWFSLPVGRHIVLSACSAEEEAKELSLGGEQRGAFSYYLLDTLQRTGPALSYRDLFKRVDAQVRLCVSAQSPLMEATQGLDLNQPFLGGAIQATPPYFTVSYDRQRQWIIDGGAIHGIAAPGYDETTRLALFPLDATLDELRDLAGAIGTAAVTEVFPGKSAVQLALDQSAAPDTGTTYKAVVTALPLPPLVVALEGDPAALALLRSALASADPRGSPSLTVREGDASAATYFVQAADDHYRIRRKGDTYALVVDTVGFTQDGATLVVRRLEQIARWLLIARLDNPATELPPDAMQMEVQVRDARGTWQPAPAGSTLRLEYRFEDGAWREPQFKVKFANRGNRRLYFMLLDLPTTYGVFPVLPGGGFWLDPGQEAWANHGEPFYGSVLDSLWQAGVIEFNDTLKLIVSTEASDATLLQQDDLPVTLRDAAFLAKSVPAHLNTLNRLLLRVPTRHISAQPGGSDAYADWTAVDVGLTIVRPQPSVPVPAADGRAPLGHGVTLLGHPALTGRARLTDLPQVGRDAGNVTLPALLRDHPEAVKPFEFVTGRSGEPGLSVLELVDVRDAETVTEDAPLVVQIDRALTRDEALLPLGFDGEFYLPLGYARRQPDHTEVVLDRLPAPTRQGSRDPQGAIRIYFQKVVDERIGLEFPYPILAAVDVAVTGAVTYQPAADAVAARVATARRILLYVHGILGDTRSMVSSARTGWLGLTPPPPALADHYDLLLAFDYENINTSIEQTARDLKARLAAVGLGPDHDKTLHIIAHSMGGLVSRWFVEREEGNRVVEQLILAGTPSAGSPWPTVQDWAFATLAVGLNGMAAVTWPVKALGSLVSATEAIDVALDQMRPKSDFLTSLAASPDPHLPYTVIAGNTSIIPAARVAEGDGGKSRLARLWAKIKRRNWLHTGANLLFFSQPNDIAVSVTSIRSVPDRRTPSPVKVEVACDHLTYFSTQAGLEALADVVLTVTGSAP